MVDGELFLVDTTARDTTIELFGHRISAPTCFAPGGVNKVGRDIQNRADTVRFIIQYAWPDSPIRSDADGSTRLSFGYFPLPGTSHHILPRTDQTSLRLFVKHLPFTSDLIQLGELNAAKVAGELIIPYCLSTAGLQPTEDVARVNGNGPRSF